MDWKHTGVHLTLPTKEQLPELAYLELSHARISKLSIGEGFLAL
jgi:hypothetical protein